MVSNDLFFWHNFSREILWQTWNYKKKKREINILDHISCYLSCCKKFEMAKLRERISYQSCIFFWFHITFERNLMEIPIADKFKFLINYISYPRIKRTFRTLCQFAYQSTFWKMFHWLFRWKKSQIATLSLTDLTPKGAFIPQEVRALKQVLNTREFHAFISSG